MRVMSKTFKVDNVPTLAALCPHLSPHISDTIQTRYGKYQTQYIRHNIRHIRHHRNDYDAFAAAADADEH